MRIAFITSEFVTDHQHGGGLANYLHRMAKLLVEHGHEVELFLPSAREPRVLMLDGIRVERVPVPQAGRLTRMAYRTVLRHRLYQRQALINQAQALAAAMERRHAVAPFQIIQSADFEAVGVAVQSRAGRIHLVRCSSAADLYNEIDGQTSRAEKCREELEREGMRKADKLYAPSRYVADHFRNRHGIAVDVVRPPLALEAIPATQPPCGLPDRFLVFFGQFMERKGLAWLGKALPLAFAAEPSLRMVLVGKEYRNRLGEAMAGLGANRGKIVALYPLPKPQLYALVQQAEAAVLPSLVDNLPNTVIESLMLGIPVIGTRGASVDELIEQDITGELVPPNDAEALASAIVKVWRGQSAVKKGFKWQSGLSGEMQPERAVAALLRLASNR